MIFKIFILNLASPRWCTSVTARLTSVFSRHVLIHMTFDCRKFFFRLIVFFAALSSPPQRFFDFSRLLTSPDSTKFINYAGAPTLDVTSFFFSVFLFFIHEAQTFSFYFWYRARFTFCFSTLVSVAIFHARQMIPGDFSDAFPHS